MQTLDLHLSEKSHASPKLFSIHSIHFLYIQNIKKNITILLLQECARQRSREFHLLRWEGKIRLCLHMQRTYSWTPILLQPCLSPGAADYNLSPHTAHNQCSAPKRRTSFMLEFSKRLVPVNRHSLLFFGSPLSNACRIRQINAGKVRGQWLTGKLVLMALSTG